MRKTKVLLNWDTSRKDLLEPFIKLKDDIEFVIIWGEYSPGEKANHPFEQVYFTDFKTPYQLLDTVKPDKVLFFNINSFPHVALNLASKNRGIRTYTMHHGIHHSDNLEINREKVRKGLHVKRKPVSNIASLLFYFSAVRPKNISQVISLIRFAWIRQKRDRVLAAEKCVFDGRLPDRYINLSPHNAIISKLIDHVKGDDKFIYIGHPFFDGILQQLNELEKKNETPGEKYFLLIDFPNMDSILQFKLMTAEGKKDFYKRLSALALSFGCRLKIKMHPVGFDSPHNYTDDNIDLVREADMAALIHNAEKCFSFFSTLLIPIIYHKGSCFVFHIGHDRHLQRELVDLGVAIRLETDNFKADELDLPAKRVSTEAYKTFIERYLYFTDGKSTDRLKHVLQEE